jgi:hypothetical protein
VPVAFAPGATNGYSANLQVTGGYSRMQAGVNSGGPGALSAAFSKAMAPTTYALTEGDLVPRGFVSAVAGELRLSRCWQVHQWRTNRSVQRSLQLPCS